MLSNKVAFKTVTRRFLNFPFKIYCIEKLTIKRLYRSLARSLYILFYNLLTVALQLFAYFRGIQSGINGSKAVKNVSDLPKGW